MRSWGLTICGRGLEQPLGNGKADGAAAQLPAGSWFFSADCALSFSPCSLMMLSSDIPKLKPSMIAADDLGEKLCERTKSMVSTRSITEAVVTGELVNGDLVPALFASCEIWTGQSAAAVGKSV